MNKQNSIIFVVSLCIVAVLCLLFCSDNIKKPNSEQNSSTTSTSVDNLSTTEQTQPTPTHQTISRLSCLIFRVIPAALSAR